MDHGQSGNLAEFFRANYLRLVDYVRGRMRDKAHQSGEDIVQDVMLSMLDRPDILAPIADLSAYVFRALRNRIIDLYRSPADDTVPLEDENDEGLSLFDVLPDRKNHPEETYARRSRHRLLIRLISELPEAQMRVIVETEFNQRTFRELSREWSTPMGTLLARKHRGMTTLRRELEKCEEAANV
jgi:RNA polymerase sigma factor (sigma-70 family)